jgi:hypothetical protein
VLNDACRAEIGKKHHWGFLPAPHVQDRILVNRRNSGKIEGFFRSLPSLSFSTKTFEKGGGFFDLLQTSSLGRPLVSPKGPWVLFSSDP